MIGVKNRFHGYGSLRYVYKKGHTVRGPLFALKAIENAKRENYRLAVVVSRKVSKSAVVRNRIRRRLYEAFREIDSDLLGSWDIVITVYNDAVAEEPWANLKKQLTKQLLEAGITKK